MKLNKENIQNKKMKILIVESSVELRAFYSGAIRKSDKFEVITLHHRILKLYKP